MEQLARLSGIRRFDTQKGSIAPVARGDILHGSHDDAGLRQRAQNLTDGGGPIFALNQETGLASGQAQAQLLDGFVEYFRRLGKEVQLGGSLTFRDARKAEQVDSGFQQGTDDTVGPANFLVDDYAIVIHALDVVLHSSEWSKWRARNEWSGRGRKASRYLISRISFSLLRAARSIFSM